MYRGFRLLLLVRDVSDRLAKPRADCIVLSIFCRGKPNQRNQRKSGTLHAQGHRRVFAISLHQE